MLHGTVAIALALVTASDPGPAPTVTPEPVEAGVEPVPATEAPLAGTPVAPPPPPSLVLVEPPVPVSLRPPPPAYDGRGLLIAAGVMGALNLGLVGARLGLGLGEVTAQKEQTRLILTAVATPIDLAAGIGLAAGGGYLRGRRDGYFTAFDHSPKLRARAFTGSGVILLVMGAVAWASAWTPWYGDPSLDARGNGSLVVEAVGSLLLMGGSGLVAYGVSWQKHTNLYGRTIRPVALRPALGRGFAGLALSGRF